MIVKDLFCNNEAYTHENWRYEGVTVGFSRLYYVIDGEAYYEEQGKKVRLKKGYLYLTPVKVPFTLSENPKDKLLHTYVHIYTVPRVVSFTEIEVVSGTPLADAVAMWRRYASTEDKELLIAIVQLVLSCVDIELGKENKAARLARKYIDENEGVCLSMSQLVATVGYTREHITRAFVSAYRMTPMQYVNSRRMELARRFVQSGMSVKETAESLGYSNPYSFSKAFKKYYGLSPELYLKTVK